MIFQLVTLPDGVYFPARPVFDALRATNYSQWARVGGVVKMPISTPVGDVVTDMLPALELYRVVFGSRSANALAVQTALLEQSLSGFGVAKAPEPQPAPVVVQAHTQVYGPVHVSAKQTPMTKQTTLAIDPRTEVMLDVLKPYRPRGVAEAREAIARCIGKYDMPEQAWINYQYDQVAGLMTEEGLMNMPDFLSLKADRDPSVNWEAERIKL